MNRKGDIDFGIIGFIAVVAILIMLAPILYGIVNKILTPLGSSLGNQSVQAGQAVSSIQTGFNSMWDGVIIVLFVLNVILLFVSAFLVDVHPIFIVIYILLAFFTVIFAPTIIDSVQAIWAVPEFNAGTNLTLTQTILDNFGIIIMGIIIVTGVILFTKFSWGGRR